MQDTLIVSGGDGAPSPDTTVGLKARGPIGKLAPGLADKLPQDVEETSVVLFVAYFVHGLLTIFCWAPFVGWFSGWLSPSWLQIEAIQPAVKFVMIAGPFIHCIMMPFFILQKKRYLANERKASLTKTNSTFEPGGKTVVFSIRFTLIQKIFMLCVGMEIAFINGLIKIISIIGLDLSCFWFPQPFYEFWQSQLQVKNYQILGAKLRLNATQADAYFRFIEEALLNFYTFGLYSKIWAKIKKKSYTKWLDDHVEWEGLPPPGLNNEFQIFNDKLNFIQKIVVMFCELCLMWVPFMQPWGAYISYTLRLKNLEFGGAKPKFVPEFTLQALFRHYIRSLCLFGGLCIGKQKQFVDSNIAQPEPDLESTGSAPMPQPPRMQTISPQGPSGQSAGGL